MYCFKLYFYNASGAPLGQCFPFLKVFNQRIFTVYCSLFCLKYTNLFFINLFVKKIGHKTAGCITKDLELCSTQKPQHSDFS